MHHQPVGAGCTGSERTWLHSRHSYSAGFVSRMAASAGGMEAGFAARRRLAPVMVRWRWWWKVGCGRRERSGGDGWMYILGGGAMRRGLAGVAGSRGGSDAKHGQTIRGRESYRHRWRMVSGRAWVAEGHRGNISRNCASARAACRGISGRVGKPFGFRASSFRALRHRHVRRHEGCFASAPAKLQTPNSRQISAATHHAATCRHLVPHPQPYSPFQTAQVVDAAGRRRYVLHLPFHSQPMLNPLMCSSCVNMCDHACVSGTVEQFMYEATRISLK